MKSGAWNFSSDWPVFAQRDNDGDKEIRFVSFPISSEVAVLINDGGSIRRDVDPIDGVRAINYQTLERAQEFVICHQESFPGDDLLAEWPKRSR